MVNTLYKERFPKATQQMEERLSKFIEENEGLDSLELTEEYSVPIARFVHHQVLEVARDCLQKSQEKLITSRYFYEMTENLEKLLAETKEKSPEAAAHLSRLVRRLLLIVSRPARLLECLEFDPEEFYHLLEQAEGQARFTQGLKTDIPQYIIGKLGLTRDPLAELKDDLDQFDSSMSRDEDDHLTSEKEDTDDGNKTPEKKESTPVPQTSTPKQGSCEETEKKVKQPSEEDFEIVKLISNGAYGAVYLVKQKGNKNELFALKRINKHNLILRNQVEQVFAERDIMSFTDNPFVVSMICTFETKKHLCMVMEYVQGGDCASLLKGCGPFPLGQARFYFAETVLAVEYLHSYGIVHRDLKPDNLLITSMGHIKLTDFGLSKMGIMSLATNLYEDFLDREAHQFSDKQVFGTPEYIAPEVILRQGYGKPVDWWSMGIILYEFLIGCVPFFGETPEELFAHVVNDDIEWPEDDDFLVQPEAKGLISTLLQQDPRNRLGTGGAMEVKDHMFFQSVDWDSVLRQKAEFVPHLENEEDTSYFDTRAERYNHELIADDSEDADDSPQIGSYSSYSPRWKRVHSRLTLDSTGHSDLSESPPSLLASTTATPDTDATTHGTLAETPRSMSEGDRRLRREKTPPSSSSGSGSTVEMKKPVSLHPSVSPIIRTTCSQPSTTTSPACPPHQTLVHAVVPLGPLQSTPESSQTESEDVSPQVQRRRRLHRNSLPRFSISVEDDHSSIGTPEHVRELSPVCESERPSRSRTSTKPNIQAPRASLPGPPLSPNIKQHTRPVIKSASASGLSLMIPTDEITPQPVQSPGGSSTASSRDTSPCRELSPHINSLKPPIVIRRGARGFGFTIRAIRVYLGDSDIYTVHHLVMAVEECSPAFEAGLRPGDLITHINGEPVQGLFHTQVMHLLLSGGDRVNIRATPLENTSIKAGGRRRHPGQGKLARRPNPHVRRRQKRADPDKKRKSSLLRQLSNKRATAEMQQMAAASNTSSPPTITPSRSLQSLSRSLSSQDSLPGSPTRSKSPHSPPTNRLFSPSDSAHSTANSSQSSSPSSSIPNSPAGSSQFQRPSTLHGLKHKIPGPVPTKNFNSPSAARRKSVGHIPLSPLARTPSPGPMPTSPTRSPSPLAFPSGHHPGSSNTVQTYSPSLTGSSSKKSYTRPKSAEPGSPLLRRALSPDRLHPRSAEGKGKSGTPGLSPLVTPPKTKMSMTPPQASPNLKSSVTGEGSTGRVIAIHPSSGTHDSPPVSTATIRVIPPSPVPESSHTTHDIMLLSCPASMSRLPGLERIAEDPNLSPPDPHPTPPDASPREAITNRRKQSIQKAQARRSHSDPEPSPCRTGEQKVSVRVRTGSGSSLKQRKSPSPENSAEGELSRKDSQKSAQEKREIYKQSQKPDTS